MLRAWLSTAYVSTAPADHVLLRCYVRVAECSRWPLSREPPQVFTNDKVDSQAYVAYLPEAARIVVAFRGSHTKINWLLSAPP